MGSRLTSSLLLVLAMLLALPGAAGAHARLTSSVPADGAVLEAAPDFVELVFSDPSTAGPGSIQVFAPDEARVEVGDPSPSSGARLTQAIRADQPGTYGVAYRVSSEDGHVITGALTFSIGSPTAGGGAADASRDAAAVDRGLQVAFSTARFVEVLALLVAAGGGLFACLVAPGWRPRLVLGALLVLLAAYAAGFVVNAAIIRGGGFADGLGGDALRAARDTPFGRSLQVRAAIALVAIGPALLLRGSRPLGPASRWAMALVFAGLAATLSLTGHAVTTGPTWLRLPLDMVHVAAAAVWLGGLVQLAYLAPTASTRIDALARFSRLAFASVVVLLLTGAWATWAELGVHPRELLDSAYGRLVVAKFVLYLGTLPLAGTNMRSFVPAVRRRPDDATRMLRQYVWREVALLLVVLVLTVWLIATPQPT